MIKLLRGYMIILISIIQLLFLCGSIKSDIQDAKTLKYNLIFDMPDIYITQISESIGHTWSNGNVWDKQLIQKFYSILTTRNDFFVVFDLGAQTGSFSLLAKYFPDSTWYAFEPIQEAAQALKENLIINNIQNVFVYQNAVSDYSGKITLKMPNMNEWGLSTIGTNVLRFIPVIERQIECIDLDSFVKTQNIKKVHFMKLDTEGSELKILRGAKKMIARDRPIMILEYNEINMKQCGIRSQELDEFLIEMKYEWKFISSEDILCTPIIS